MCDINSWKNGHGTTQHHAIVRASPSSTVCAAASDGAWNAPFNNNDHMFQHVMVTLEGVCS